MEKLLKMSVVITKQLAIMFGKIGDCPQCGRTNTGLLPTGENNQFVCGICGRDDKVVNLIITAAEIVAEKELKHAHRN